MEPKENIVNKGEKRSIDFSFIIKKTEKLASALYMVTGFFRDEEPLKWKLRSLGSSLISTSLHFSNLSLGSEKIRRDLGVTALEIKSLLGVAKISGLVSDMNHAVLDREFGGLLSALGLSEEESEGSEVSFEENFFSVKSAPQIESKIAPEKYVSEDYSDRVELRERPTELLPRISHRYTANRIDKPKEPKLKEFGVVAVKKNARQSIIIGLLKRKREIMIKDVSPLIQGVSEKTIQRELLSMVSEGILKKEGEKRWSRYSVAS